MCVSVCVCVCVRAHFCHFNHARVSVNRVLSLQLSASKEETEKVKILRSITFTFTLASRSDYHFFCAFLLKRKAKEIAHEYLFIISLLLRFFCSNNQQKTKNCRLTVWQRPIICLILLASFRISDNTYRTLWQKMTSKDID